MQRPGFLAGLNGFTPRRSRFGNFGASGATKWYWGQHAKVCGAIDNGNLKEAIEHATALHDYPLKDKKPEEVLQSPQLLAAFKQAFLGFKGKMHSYTDQTLAKGAQLIDNAIRGASAKQQAAAPPQVVTKEAGTMRSPAPASAGASPEEQAKLDAEKAKMDEEIAKLEAEQASAFAVPTGVPTTAQTYTGGSVPMYGRKAGPTPEEQRQARLEQLVSSHETEGALQRASSPKPVDNAPPPPPPMPMGPPAPAEKPGFFEWIRNTLFGPPAPDYGLGESTTNWTRYIAYGAIALVLYKMFLAKDESTIQA